MTITEKLELKEQGYTILRNRIPLPVIENLSKSIDKVFTEHKKIQENNGNEIQTYGVALHALLSDHYFVEFAGLLVKGGFVKELEDGFFKSKCILNSMSALDNIPGQPNFSINVHRDIRFYSNNFNIMLNCLVMVDDFTIENGGTLVLPESHKQEERPTDEYFKIFSKQITGKKGDVLVFDANVFHSSAPNTTQEHRRAIPITISKSCMKQLLDYPRALGYDRVKFWDPELLQFLGYDSRVPASLDEFYQPEDKRFYKKGQD